MNIEDQICSPELAKKLRELKFEKESYFAYFMRVYPESGWELSVQTKNKLGLAAYSVAELGEMLPEDYISCKTAGTKFPDLEYKKYWLCYFDPDGCDSCNTQMEESEANARAKMLIYLLEHELIRNA